MTEHDIQNSIRLKLSEQGFCTFRINTGRVQTKDGRWFSSGVPKGFSDLIAIKDGKIYFIEVKTRTGVPSREQEKFLAVMRERYGCTAGICRSVEDALELIKCE